jgi:hypothetical protein
MSFIDWVTQDTKIGVIAIAPKAEHKSPEVVAIVLCRGVGS